MTEKRHVFSTHFEHSEALLEAALAEFTEHGYGKASINRILQVAGMSKGQFYYHFKNKEGLYFALIGLLIERKREFLASVMKPEDFQQDVFGIVRTQIRYGLAFARAYPAINEFAESFIREQGNPIYEKALVMYSFENDSSMSQLIAVAYERGELRNDLPLDFIRHIFTYLLTHAAEAAALNAVDDFEPQLEYLMQFLQSGLAAERKDIPGHEDV